MEGKSRNIGSNNVIFKNDRLLSSSFEKNLLYAPHDGLVPVKLLAPERKRKRKVVLMYIYL